MKQAKDKLSVMDELAEFVQEADQAITEDRGGYPAQIAVIPGFLVVASTVDKDNEPELDIYTEATCKKWLKAIRKSQKDYPEEDTCFHVLETTPKADY